MRRGPWVQREIAARWILLDLNTCHAIWRLPARQPRKETGQ